MNTPSDTRPGASRGPLALYANRSLGIKILIWMAIGAVAGVLIGEPATVVKPIGDLFIRLLLMAAIPLVFFNLVAGIVGLADVSVLGRLGLSTMLYYFFTTSVALTLGLTVVTLLQPGVGMSLAAPAQESFGSVPALTDVVLNLFPDNVFRAFADGEVGQIVVFAVFVGITTLMLPAQSKDKLRSGFVLAAELLRKLVGVVMYFGPLGVGALAASTAGTYGSAIIGPMARFILCVWVAHAGMVLLYMALIWLFARANPMVWLRRTGVLYATAAATCSSLASLVVAMDVAEKRLSLPRSIYSFTLPLGAQLNKDGTSIMLSCVLLFTAQAVGVEFTVWEAVTIVLVGLLLSEGSGGIPGGGLVIALIFVEAFNLPTEIAGIVAGIYRLIDMTNTTVNVMGDMTWTTILSRRWSNKEQAG